jgi:hypothetical protein
VDDDLLDDDGLRRDDPDDFDGALSHDDSLAGRASAARDGEDGEYDKNGTGHGLKSFHDLWRSKAHADRNCQLRSDVPNPTACSWPEEDLNRKIRRW